MSDTSDLVSVVVTESTAAVTQQGFGTPLIMSCEASTVFPLSRARIYTQTKDAVTDGFSAAGATVAALTAAFAQQPAVNQVVVGRRANLPTKVVVLTPVVVNSASYSVTIDGTTYTAVSDSSATAAEIVTAINALITADSGAPVTPTGSVTSILTAKVAGHIFSLSTNNARFTQLNTTADPGIVADITAVQTDPTGNDDWYGITLDSSGKAELLAAAAYVNGLNRQMSCVSADDEILTATTGNVMKAVMVANYRRVSVSYHPKPHQFQDMAWMSARLCKVPGSANWMYCPLSGVDGVVLSATQRTNIKNQLGNYFRTAGGRSFMMNGTVGNGDYIDNVLLVDWTVARIQEAVFGDLVSHDKVAIVDKGITSIQNDVQSVLNAGVANGGYTNNPAPVTTVPKASAVSAQDRAARALNGVAFAAFFANAINTVGVTGIVSV